MGLFNMLSNSSKEAEIGQLINKTMKVTHTWEVSGEKPGGQEIIEAATAIRLNATKIINLYCDLVSVKGTKNLYFKNEVLPPPMPKELSVQTMIMAIITFSSKIGAKNPSFKHGLIEPTAIDRFIRI